MMSVTGHRFLDSSADVSRGESVGRARSNTHSGIMTPSAVPISNPVLRVDSTERCFPWDERRKPGTNAQGHETHWIV